MQSRYRVGRGRGGRNITFLPNLRTALTDRHYANPLRGHAEYWLHCRLSFFSPSLFPGTFSFGQTNDEACLHSLSHNQHCNRLMIANGVLVYG